MIHVSYTHLDVYKRQVEDDTGALLSRLSGLGTLQQSSKIPRSGPETGFLPAVFALKYNGPVISDHSSKNYREHGKIQQESEKETTP